MCSLCFVIFCVRALSDIIKRRLYNVYDILFRINYFSSIYFFIIIFCATRCAHNTHLRGNVSSGILFFTFLLMDRTKYLNLSDLNPSVWLNGLTKTDKSASKQNFKQIISA